MKIHRKFISWEWYSDTNVARLFLHLILKANHVETRWRGEAILRGQLLTGRSLLSAETGLTEQEVRTALTKLKSTGEITIRSTSKFSVVTLCNYDKYQEQQVCNQPAQQPAAQPASQPTGNQQSTTSKNLIIKEEKKHIKPAKFKHELFKPVCVSTELWDEFIENRKFKKLQNTETALKAIMASFEKGTSQYSYTEMITEYVSSRMQRFDPSWMKKGNETIPTIQQPTGTIRCHLCDCEINPACRARTDEKRKACTDFREKAA